MTDNFRVPVDRAPVTLFLLDGSRQQGAVFLAPGVTIPELFETELPFLPVLREKRFCLYSRTGVVAIQVEVETPWSGHQEIEGLDMPDHKLRVSLRSGTVLEGSLRFLAPPEKSRTADFLNQLQKSFPLYVNGTVIHICKDHVEYAEEM